jgi:hypothetical protein
MLLVTACAGSRVLPRFTGPRAPSHRPSGYWPLPIPTVIQPGMRAHPEQRITDRRRNARKRPGKQTAETIARRLLEIVVYDKRCRIGGTLSLNDLAETSEIGDWKMPDYSLSIRSVSGVGDR